jgi:hypothetical protein
VNALAVQLVAILLAVLALALIAGGGLLDAG